MEVVDLGMLPARPGDRPKRPAKGLEAAQVVDAISKAVDIGSKTAQDVVGKGTAKKRGDEVTFGDTGVIEILADHLLEESRASSPDGEPNS